MRHSNRSRLHQRRPKPQRQAMPRKRHQRLQLQFRPAAMPPRPHPQRRKRHPRRRKQLPRRIKLHLPQKPHQPLPLQPQMHPHPLRPRPLPPKHQQRPPSRKVPASPKRSSSNSSSAKSCIYAAVFSTTHSNSAKTGSSSATLRRVPTPSAAFRLRRCT